MGEAFFWGLVGGSSLVIGGAIARHASLTRRHVGLIMAFGAGVLISAVAYELFRRRSRHRQVTEGSRSACLRGRPSSSAPRF
jgi:hypothetical protein